MQTRKVTEAIDKIITALQHHRDTSGDYRPLRDGHDLSLLVLGCGAIIDSSDGRYTDCDTHRIVMQARAGEDLEHVGVQHGYSLCLSAMLEHRLTARYLNNKAADLESIAERVEFFYQSDADFARDVGRGQNGDRQIRTN